MEQNNIRTGKEFEKIDDFSFTDYNNDNFDDILIINVYKMKNDTEKEVQFYMQETNKIFTLDQQLSEKVNSEIEDKTVLNVKKFLEKNKEADLTGNSKYIVLARQLPLWQEFFTAELVKNMKDTLITFVVGVLFKF